MLTHARSFTLAIRAGTNSGTVKGHKYFTCAPKHGVLCAPSKVSKRATSAADKSPTKTATATDNGSTDTKAKAASKSGTTSDKSPSATTSETSTTTSRKANEKKATKKTDDGSNAAASTKADESQASISPDTGADASDADVVPVSSQATTSKESVVTLQRTDPGQSFGFGIAQVYAGYDEKWVTVVSDADSSGQLAGLVGHRVLDVECDRARGEETTRVDLSTGIITAHESALAALRSAGTVVRLTVFDRRPAAPPMVSVDQNSSSGRRSSSRRVKPHCGNTVWCRCPRCSRAAVAAHDRTRATSGVVVRNPTESMAVSTI